MPDFFDWFKFYGSGVRKLEAKTEIWKIIDRREAIKKDGNIINVEKNNFWKIIIELVILIGLLAGGWFFIRNKPTKENEKNNQTQNQETEKWEIYRNEKYGFEIKYPAEWQVYAPDNSYSPIINVYKTGNPPFTHHSNVTQVSIFPEGEGNK